MKDKKWAIIIICMICITVFCGLYVFYNYPMNEEIKSVVWYNYNIKTGTYDILKIEESKLTYMYDGNEFDGCSKYYYNSKERKLLLDCGKEIVIKSFEGNSLKLIINKEEKVFFKDTDESLNYEFKKYFEKSISEYKNEKDQAREILKIEFKKLYDLYNSEERNIVVIMGDECNNLDCSLVLGVLEKWSVDNSNVYYIDSNYLTSSNLNSMNSIDSNFSKDIEFYNSNYPLVIVIGRKAMYDSKYFKCNGFDCTMWKDYSKDIKFIQ